MPATASTTPENDKPPRRKRWIPLSLQMFVSLIVLLVVGSVLWVGLPAYRQQGAIREIERCGGTVETREQGPEWIRDWWDDSKGTSPFDEVVSVDMDNKRVADADLAALRAFSRITKLNLARSHVTDAGLTHLTGLATLESLDLDDTQVTEAGLARLRGMNCLEHLKLPALRLTEKGLKELCNLPHLHDVTLDDGSELVNVEFVDIAEAHGFDLDCLLGGDFQQKTRQRLRGRRKISLVYCSAPDEIKVNHDLIDYALAKYAAYELNSNKIRVVDPDRVAYWLDKSKDWRKTSEIGSAFNVDFIVHVDIKEFAVSESDNNAVGHASCIVHVTKMNEDKRDGEVIYTRPVAASWPKGAAVDQTALSDAEFNRQFLSAVSEAIGQLFHSVKVYPAITTDSLANTSANAARHSKN